MSSTLVEVQIPDAANDIIAAAGLSVGDLVQRLVHKIASSHAVPDDLLDPASADLNADTPEDAGDGQQTAREKAIDELKRLRKQLKLAPTTMDEIIAWRDEGRR